MRGESKVQGRLWNQYGHPEIELGSSGFQPFCKGSCREGSEPLLNSEVTVLYVYARARQEGVQGELSCWLF